MKRNSGNSAMAEGSRRSKWRYSADGEMYYKFEPSGYVEIMKKMSGKSDIKSFISALERVLNFEMEKWELRRERRKIPGSSRAAGEPVAPDLPNLTERSGSLSQKTDLYVDSSILIAKVEKIKGQIPLSRVPVLSLRIRSGQDDKKAG